MDEYVERPDARISYSRTTPQAHQSVVVVHSLTTSRRWEDEAGVFDWTPIAEAGLGLVRADTRGHGYSTGGPDAEQYRWSALAEDLIAIGDVVSGERPFDALGESTGCGILLRAVLTAPGRFRRLVLVVPPTMGEARAAQAELYLAAAQMIEIRGAEAWNRLVATSAPTPAHQRRGRARPTWSAVNETLLPSVLRGAAASTFPTDDELATIRQPTLILAWQDDLSHPDSTAEHLAEHIPNSTLEIAEDDEQIPGWGGRVAAFLTARPEDGLAEAQRSRQPVRTAPVANLESR